MTSSNYVSSPLSLYDVLLAAPSAIIGANVLRQITYATAAVQEILGWSSDELIGKNLDMIIPQRFRDGHEKGYQKFVETGEMKMAGRPLRTFALTKSGKEVAIELTLGSYKTEEGDLRIISMLRDVRDYVELEQESERLRGELSYIRSITTNLAEGLIATDKDGKVTMMNTSAEKITGYHEEELLGKVAHDIVHCWNIDGSYQLRKDCEITGTLGDGNVRHVLDDYFKRKDGSFVNIAYFASPLYKNNEISGAVVTFQDVEERKKQERKLHQDEKIYRTVVENTNDMISMAEIGGNIIFANHPAHQLALGYNKDELLGRNLRDLIHPDDILTPKQEVEMLELLHKGERLPLTKNRMKSKSGDYVWVEGSGVFINRDDETIFLASYRDLTLRRNYETEVSGLIEAMPILIWTMNVKENIESFNKGWRDYTGLTNTELQSEYDKYMHPEDKDTLLTQWSKAIIEKTSLETTVRYKNISGVYKWHILRVVPIANEDGGVIRWIGAATDIDDQIHKEEYQARLASIVKYSEDSIVGITLEGLIISINPAGEKLYGYDSSEIVGKPANIICPDNRRIELEGILARLSRGQNVENLKTERVRKDGKVIEIIMNAYPLKDSTGKIIGVSVTAKRAS